METQQNFHSGVFDIDVKNLRFKKTRDKLSEHQKNYIIFDETGKPKIKLEKVFLPFGAEYYNKKQILNIEIYPNKNNTHNNLYSLLLALEQEFSDKLVHNYELKNDIAELKYYSFLKNNSNNVHIRTYMSPNPNIYTIIGKFKEPIMQSSIKGTYCNIEMELGTLWMNDTNFGVIWYVKDIQIV
jgi:hypothetical protein